MSRNGSSSPALQHHLSGEQSENAEGASPDYPVFDVTCPELCSNNGHNAYKTSCIERLTAKVVQVPCRRCEVAIEIRPDISNQYKPLSCRCGNAREKNKMYCTECREAAAKKHNQGARHKSKRKPCACGNEREHFSTYCTDCKENNRINKNAEKRAQTIQKLNDKLSAVKGEV